MYTFNISAGLFLQNGNLLDDDVYSGAWPEGFNDPTKVSNKDVGPLPAGLWRFGKLIAKHPDLGPNVIPLIPVDVPNSYGRDMASFFMHGKPLPPADIRSGSKGCICAQETTRLHVANSGDDGLTVVSGLVVVDPEIQV